MEYSMTLILCIVVLFCNRVDSRDVFNADDDPYPTKPERCYGTDEIMDARCCIIPPFYVREIARACGAIFSLVSIDEKSNVSELRRDALSCENVKCTLTKYGLLRPDDTLDEEKFYAHIDRWVGLNPEFSKVMVKAKIHCKQKYKMYMPLKVCEYYPLQVCLRRYIKMDCPSMIDSEICQQQKEFYNQCRYYFYK